MLSVTDARTGRTTTLHGTRRGLLRVRVLLACAGDVVGIGDVRALVVGDVLRRVAESHRLWSACVIAHPSLTGDQEAALARAAAALGVPAEPADGPPGEAADVTVRADGAAPDGSSPPGGTTVAVGGVTGWASPQDLPGSGGADPAVVRLALLRHGHGEPAVLDPGRLADAAGHLARWRRDVAEWARGPSRPLPGEIRAAAHSALARDLDTPAVLDLLDHVTDEPGIAPGGKFEIFAHLDRFLALELPRDVGGSPPAPPPDPGGPP